MMEAYGICEMESDKLSLIAERLKELMNSQIRQRKSVSDLY
jgi:hypothetical protein